MEFHFLTVGFLFFFVLVGVDPAPRRIPAIARIGLLFAAMPFHAFFALALMSAHNVIAQGYYSALNRPYRTDLLGDQYLAGSVAWAMGELPILLVLAAVFVQWARSDSREAVRFDRTAERARRRTESSPATGVVDPDDELGRYNAYLASLAAREHRHDEGTPR
jgi:putative copper resistance protein D